MGGWGSSLRLNWYNLDPQFFSKEAFLNFIKHDETLVQCLFLCASKVRQKEESFSLLNLITTQILYAFACCQHCITFSLPARNRASSFFFPPSKTICQTECGEWISRWQRWTVNTPADRKMDLIKERERKCHDWSCSRKRAKNILLPLYHFPGKCTRRNGEKNLRSVKTNVFLFFKHSPESNFPQCRMRCAQQGK